MVILINFYSIDHINKKTSWQHPNKLFQSNGDISPIKSSFNNNIESYKSIITSTNFLDYISNGGFNTSQLNLSQYKRGETKKVRSIKKTLAFSQCMARINPTPLEKKNGKYSGSISISEMKSNHNLVSNIRNSSPVQDMEYYNDGTFLLIYLIYSLSKLILYLYRRNSFS